MDRTEEKDGQTGFDRMISDVRRWSFANLRYAADLLLPPVCLHCHAPAADHGALCPACWQGIDFITAPFCDRLGLPLPYGGDEPLISAMALRRPPLYDRARAVACFVGVMRNLIHGFKYADRHEASGMFARMMRSAGAELLRDADVLMPVPLHPSRLWQRRYNQAALLARKLGALTGVPVDVTTLRRARRTMSQVGLSYEARKENVASAFSLAPRARQRIQGKRILLIDDVITTGSTLGACAVLLKRSGAREVNCLAMAMATQDTDRQDTQWLRDN